MLNFLENHWEWLTGSLISLVGVLISWRAYRFSKQANQDTNQLLKNSVDSMERKIDSIKKEELRSRIIEVGCSEWRLKGQTKDYLNIEYEKFRSHGWEQRDFEEIYDEIALKVKGRKFKQPLFEK